MLDEETELQFIAAIESGDAAALGELFAAHPSELIHYERPYGTWLYEAASNRSLAVVQLLVELGADVNQPLTIGFTGRLPIDAAIRDAKIDFVTFLLKSGAKPDPARQVIAAAGKSLDILKLLEQYGADIHREFVNDFTNEPMNALSQAMAYGKQDIVDYLLSKGARLPGQGESTETPDKDEVVSFCEQAFGPVDQLSLTEIVPTEPAITIHCVPPGEGRSHLTLFTSGMSEHPMNVPDGCDEFQYAEIFIQLPGDWNYKAIEDPQWGWPVHWLRSNAKYAFQNDTWLHGPVCVFANGDPPEPLAPNTQASSLLLLISPHEFTRSDGKRVRFYHMFPLYEAERQLELKHGVHALVQAFDEAGVSFVVDLDRKCVTSSKRE